MGVFTQTVRVCACLVLSALLHTSVFAVTTSWKGTVSTSWGTAANWTNGVPTTTLDVVIGDANFTGSFQPVQNVKRCYAKSLTIGGVKASTYSIGNNNYSLTVLGDIYIAANGTINQSSTTTISCSGNWTRLGTYNPTSNNSTIVFSGTAQTITGVTTFRKLTINAGSTTTLTSNITVQRTFTVNGTFNPNEPTYQVTLTGASFNVGAGGWILVYASTFAGNYTINPTLNNTSTVDYAATLSSQTVAALTYGNLRITGGTTKTAAGSFTLRSATAGVGNINVLNNSTFDLSNATVNRGTTSVGGALTVANGSTLRLAGSFPANFATYTFGPTSLTEYYGGAQTVSPRLYGHLTLSSSSGAVTKTMPTAAFTIAGNLNTSVSAGSLSFTAGNNITVQGNVTIGTSVTFGASSFTHTFSGNLTNSGTINGSTSTITMSGLNAVISGAGNYSLNNLTLTTGGITAAATTNLTIAGNLATTGPGTFTHTSGSTGTITMSGTPKTISGLSITFNNLTVSGSVSTTTDFTVMGNFSVSNTFNATAGTITFKGASKVITNTASLNYNNIDIFSGASITSSSNFSIRGNLSVTGTLSASSPSIVTFNGTSIVSGNPNLYNVTLSGTKLTLGNNAILGIANAFVLTLGTFDVTTSTPNTVNYNGSGAQNVLATTYNCLTFSTGGTKTAAGNCTVNETLTINSGVTFNGVTFTHSIYTDWVNNGTYNAGTSTVQFLGASDSYVYGATTFASLTVNKSSSATVLILKNNIGAGIINMTSGEVNTGSNTLTITTDRFGNGIIIGTITRTHPYVASTAYAFESPNNTVTFTSITTPVTSVTVTITKGSVSDFPSFACINRLYTISVTGGPYVATLRLHYEDAELNGNDESTMNLWRYNAGTYTSASKSANDVTANWVQMTGFTNIATKWTCANTVNLIRWVGSTSSAWTTASNWQTVSGSPSAPPSSSDIVEIGSASIINQPVISTAVTIRGMVFYSASAATLTLSSGGSLTTSGSVGGSWSSNATHTINTGAQNFTVGGDLVLSDGTAGRVINLTTSTGTTTIANNLVQTGNANITYSGAGNLNIGANYNYTSGTFTPATSTVTYNGSLAQILAPVTYYHLVSNKASGTLIYSSPVTVNGNLTVMTGGQFDALQNITIVGNVSIGAGTTVNSEGSTITVGGNWVNAGTFIQGSGTVLFNGTTTQSIDATIFNNLTINKTSGTINANGSISVNADLSLLAGTFDVGVHSVNRTSLGGTITLSSGAYLRLSGANNFPSNYSINAISSASTVEFNGTIAQNVPVASYGNIIFTNGGTNAKTLSNNITVSGDLTINSGARLNGNGYTIQLGGNWSNSGTFVPALGTVRMTGTGKTISGTNDFYNLTFTGTISTLTGTVTTVLGNFINTGTFTQGSDNTFFYGDFTNSGTINLNGVTNVMGTQVQVFTNNGTLTSGATGVVNYNGTISPLYFSTSTPQYATVNINNTGGVAPVQRWIVSVALNVGSGATFNGNGLTHTILGSFGNNGTVVNNGGTFTFSPTTAQTINMGNNFSCTGTVNFSGTGAITIAGSGTPTLGVVNVLNTNANGITPSSDWLVESSFLVGTGATFHGGTNRTMTVSDNITVNGIFDGGTSTVIMNDTATINGVGSITFNHLTIASVDTLLTDINISGNFVDNGAFDPTGFAVTFTGASPSVISGTTTPVPFADLIIAKSSSTVTLSNDINIAQDLTINSLATLNGGTRTINIEGQWSNSGTYTPGTSTVNFIAADNQEIGGSSVSTFYHLNAANTGFELALAYNASVAGTLTLSPNVTFNCNSNELILSSDATNTGRLAVVPTTAVFTGNLRMQRYLPAATGRYWYMMASPVTGATLSMWQNGIYITGPFTGASNPGNGINPSGTSAFYWDATAGLWKRFPNSSNTEIISTKTGYRVFVRDGNATYNGGNTTAKNFSVLGPPNIGDQTFTLPYHPNGGTPAGGWNLIGNPYPSNITGNLNNSGWTTKTNLDGLATYMWDSDAKHYVSCNGGVGACVIPSSQGFWVKVKSGGGTLVATENVKTTGTLPFYRPASDQNFIPVTLLNKDNQENDITYLRFEQDATLGFDDQYDAYKLGSGAITGASATLISSMMYTTELSINARPVPAEGDTIPLNISGESGNYSLDFSQRSDLDVTYHMYLVDHRANTTIDLSAEPVYDFTINTADSSTFWKRYDVVFSIEKVTPNQTATTALPFSVSPNPVSGSQFEIRMSDVTEEVRVLIHDVKGNIVFEKTYSKADVIDVRLNKKLLPGAYIIMVQSGNKKNQEKFIVE